MVLLSHFVFLGQLVHLLPGEVLEAPESSKVKVTVTKIVLTQWLPLQWTAHMGGMHVLQTALVYFDFL